MRSIQRCCRYDLCCCTSESGIEMNIYGKSAHAGVNPEDGISAIQVAAKAIAAMKLGRIDDETTANIGKFQGGSALNVVCDFVRSKLKPAVLYRRRWSCKLLRCVKHWKRRAASTVQRLNSTVRSCILHLVSTMNMKLYSLLSVPSAAWDWRRARFRWWQ